MFTESAKLFLCKLVSRAHRYFNFPLICQLEKRRPAGYYRFSVDYSWRYRRGALGILLLDVGSFFAMIGFACTAHIWKEEFDLPFRLILIFLDITAVLNVIIDLHSMLKKDDIGKLLNFGQRFCNSFTGKVYFTQGPISFS